MVIVLDVSKVEWFYFFFEIDGFIRDELDNVDVLCLYFLYLK